MKKVIAAALLLVIGLMAVLPFAAPNHASAEDVPHGFVRVQGWVKWSDDSGNLARVEDARVEATCNGDTIVTSTNNDGMFQAEFNLTNCQFGSTVSVVASKDDLTGVNTSLVLNDDEPDFVELNVTMTPLVGVPEMGPIVATVTGVLAVGAFALIRRRQFAQTV